MTTQLSYFHLGQITVKDTETHITSLYTTLEAQRSDATSRDTQQRSAAKQLLENVASTRARELYHLLTRDVHLSSELAKANVRYVLLIEPFLL